MVSIHILLQLKLYLWYETRWAKVSCIMLINVRDFSHLGHMKSVDLPNYINHSSIYLLTLNVVRLWYTFYYNAFTITYGGITTSGMKLKECKINQYNQTIGIVTFIILLRCMISCLLIGVLDYPLMEVFWHLKLIAIMVIDLTLNTFMCTRNWVDIGIKFDKTLMGIVQVSRLAWMLYFLLMDVFWLFQLLAMHIMALSRGMFFLIRTSMELGIKLDNIFIEKV